MTGRGRREVWEGRGEYMGTVGAGVSGVIHLVCLGMMLLAALLARTSIFRSSTRSWICRCDRLVVAIVVIVVGPDSQ